MGEVDFPKLINKYILRDKVAPRPESGLDLFVPTYFDSGSALSNKPHTLVRESESERESERAREREREREGGRERERERESEEGRNGGRERESEHFRGQGFGANAQNVQWLRGRLVFEAHRLLYHSA